MGPPVRKERGPQDDTEEMVPWNLANCLGFRAATRVFRLTLGFESALFEGLFERTAGVVDVLSEQVASCYHIALPAELEDLMMFLVGPLHAVS